MTPRETIDSFLLLHSRMKEKVAEATQNDVTMLVLIESESGITPSRVAKLRSVSTAAITGCVDRLEELGLANRRYGGEDRREIPIFLTDYGRQVFDFMKTEPATPSSH